jgi:glycine cleavage system transcriptional repressor
MKQWYMLTVVGRDQTGIVSGLARALYQGGAVLGEASMTSLGGNFTIMMMVQVEVEEAELKHQLEAFTRKMNLHVYVDRIEEHHHELIKPNVRIAVHDADRPGVVSQVTAVLAEAGFNILDLHSDVGGTGAKPIHIMVIDGHAKGGVEAVMRDLESIRLSGIEVRLSSIDTPAG